MSEILADISWVKSLDTLMVRLINGINIEMGEVVITTKNHSLENGMWFSTKYASKLMACCGDTTRHPNASNFAYNVYGGFRFKDGEVKLIPVQDFYGHTLIMTPEAAYRFTHGGK